MVNLAGNLMTFRTSNLVVEGNGAEASGTQLMVEGGTAQLQQLVMEGGSGQLQQLVVEGGSGQLQLLAAGQEIYQILTPEGTIQVIKELVNPNHYRYR
jgi:hypothetical protein